MKAQAITVEKMSHSFAGEAKETETCQSSDWRDFKLSQTLEDSVNGFPAQ